MRSCAHAADEASYWSGVPLEGAELYPRPDRMIVAGPTNEEQTLVIVYWPNDRFHEIRTDIEGSFLAALDLAPSFAERVRAGERSDRFFGTAYLPFFFRKPFGPGWALVGDAGGTTRIPSRRRASRTRSATQGWSQMRSTTVSEVAGRWTRRSPPTSSGETRRRGRSTSSLDSWPRWRPPPPDMQQLFAALRENQEQINRFFGTIAGTVRVPEFFSPENLAQISRAGAVAVA